MSKNNTTNEMTTPAAEPATTATLRSAWEICNDFENATAGLEEIPQLLQLLINSYDLDSQSLTKDQVLNIGTAKPIIYSVLCITQQRLWDICEKIEKIKLRKEGDES